MIEEWRPIEGLDNYYHVSNLGRVKSLARKRKLGRYHRDKEKLETVLMPQIVRGYPYVVLEVSAGIFTFRRNVAVHRVVAQEFVPNKLGKPEVNHINGNKMDNRAANLEWVTKSENVKHAYDAGLRSSPPGNSKFSAETIEKVFALRKQDMFHREIAKELGMGVSTVTHILLGTRRKKETEKSDASSET